MPAFQDRGQIDGDQRDRGGGRDQIGEPETDVFREADEQQEENSLRQPDQQILDGMDRQRAQMLKGEEGGEAERDEQDAVFHCPRRLLVNIDGIDQADLKAVMIVGNAVGGQRRGAPAGGKTLLADFAAARQVVTAKARVRPLRDRKSVV